MTISMYVRMWHDHVRVYPVHAYFPTKFTLSSSLLTVSPSSLSSRRPANLHTHYIFTDVTNSLCTSKQHLVAHLLRDPTVSLLLGVVSSVLWVLHSEWHMHTHIIPWPHAGLLTLFSTPYQLLVLARRRGLTSPPDGSRPLGISLQRNSTLLDSYVQLNH